MNVYKIIVYAVYFEKIIKNYSIKHDCLIDLFPPDIFTLIFIKKEVEIILL